MNTQFEIEQICSQMHDLITKHADIIECKTLSLQENVLSLLNSDKPKIMVYGIYNAGKSTLINALIGKQVAEVRDCPATWRIDEYDNGNYVLIDSPGVDAPIEHQKITEEHIAKCHAIMYVISTKGGFESVKNYQNMYQLMQMGQPFIIIINDKEGDPDLNQSENINKIKYKIIQNLRKISNNNSIENVFDMIAVNAKRGFDAQTRGRLPLYERSNIELLKNRITYFLDYGNAMHIYITPIHNLITLIDDVNTQVSSHFCADDIEKFKTYRKFLMLKKEYIIKELPFRIDNVVMRYEQTLLQSAYQGNSRQWEENFDQLYREVESVMQNYLDELIAYLNSNFAEIDFSDMTVAFSSEVYQHEALPESQYQDILQSKDHSDSNENETLEKSSGKLAGTVLAAGASVISGSVIPIAIEEGAKLLYYLLMKRSQEKQKQAKQEFLELQAKLEQSNREAEERANAEAKRRQDIRIQTETRLHQIRTQLRTDITQQFIRILDSAEACIDHTLNANQEQNHSLIEISDELRAMRERAIALKTKIKG